MILYLDTSALLKKYFKETFSEQIVSAWKQATAIVTSAVTYAEGMASIYRKKREVDVDPASVNRVIRSFHDDWDSLIKVDVGNRLNRFVDRLVGFYPLRGFDAIHLSSAMAVNESIPEGIIFACFDKTLLQAAVSEGLTTLPSPDSI